MAKGLLIFFGLIQAFVGTALAGGAEADASSRRDPPPIYYSAPQAAPTVAIDPSTFQPTSSGEQVKALKGKIEELSKKLQTVLDYRDEKTRITELRELLRETTQFKLTLTSIDAILGKSRDDELREFAVARQILAGQQPAFGINSNLPTDQIQKWGQAEGRNSNFLADQIDQEQKLLRTLGGARGDRLVALSETIDNTSYRKFSDRTKAIREQVRSILDGDDDDTEKAVVIAPVAPRPTDDSVPQGPNTKPPEEDSNGKTGSDASKATPPSSRSDSIAAQAVDALLRLSRLMLAKEISQRRLEYGQTLYSNKKRLDDYHDVDVKITDLRSEDAQLQAKVAALQDSINQGIDTAVNQIGGHEWFTQIATGIFGAAVVIVIGSFFALAFRDKENRLLAHPDVGLQFVTLFSIIIAIILFGILNILGSKELSALLGGISGYILGRGTLGFSDRKRPCSEDRDEKERHPSDRRADPQPTGTQA